MAVRVVPEEGAPCGAPRRSTSAENCPTGPRQTAPFRAVQRQSPSAEPGALPVETPPGTPTAACLTQGGGECDRFDDQGIYRGAGTVDHLQRRSRVEEGVLPVGGAVRSQGCKIYDLGESDSEVPHQRVVERQGNPGYRMDRYFIGDGVCDQIRNLHLLEPFDQLPAVGQSRLIESFIELVLGRGVKVLQPSGAGPAGCPGGESRSSGRPRRP